MCAIHDTLGDSPDLKDIMFDPSSLTLGQISSAVRDFTVVGILLTTAWKARGWYEHAVNFFTRFNKHMDAMESGMNTLLTNHLTHIEADLAKLTGRIPDKEESGE